MRDLSVFDPIFSGIALNLTLRVSADHDSDLKRLYFKQISFRIDTQQRDGTKFKDKESAWTEGRALRLADDNPPRVTTASCAVDSTVSRFWCSQHLDVCLSSARKDVTSATQGQWWGGYVLCNLELRLASKRNCSEG